MTPGFRQSDGLRGRVAPAGTMTLAREGPLLEGGALCLRVVDGRIEELDLELALVLAEVGVDLRVLGHPHCCERLGCRKPIMEGDQPNDEDRHGYGHTTRRDPDGETPRLTGWARLHGLRTPRASPREGDHALRAPSPTGGHVLGLGNGAQLSCGGGTSRAALPEPVGRRGSSGEGCSLPSGPSESSRLKSRTAASSSGKTRNISSSPQCLSALDTVVERPAGHQLAALLKHARQLQMRHAIVVADTKSTAWRSRAIRVVPARKAKSMPSSN